MYTEPRRAGRRQNHHQSRVARVDRSSYSFVMRVSRQVCSQRDAEDVPGSLVPGCNTPT
jgi:hypothetical protein